MYLSLSKYSRSSSESQLLITRANGNLNVMDQLILVADPLMSI